MNTQGEPLPGHAPARRTLLRAGVASVTLTAAGAGAGSAVAADDPPDQRRPATPDQALHALAAGNRRWRTLHQTHPHESRSVRVSLSAGQHPFAVVLGCIDSRVPPELVFDQGLGDLMTVRTAGEVLDEAVLGSIAYGVLELGIPLVVVLGHQSCGAVRAAVEADLSGERLPAHIQYLADQITPYIDHSSTGDARIDATVDAQVRGVRTRLAAEPDLAARISDGRLAVVGSRYELDTQRVHRLA